ncbi:spore germination protein [Paenibacillus sp. 2KB_22]|uniref:spore germination protein n=1 Tax=Paenibacillus sp. 2KB_22 TaxID=3232978 RepID=UPI003F97D046
MQIDKIKNDLSRRFRLNSDFVQKELEIGETTFEIFFFNTLVNYETAIEQINYDILRGHKDSYVSRLDFSQEVSSSDQISHEILQGKLILTSKDGVFLFDSLKKTNISRAVSAPESENPLQSAYDAFTEDIDVNMGLIRKKMNSENLTIETRTLGKNTMKKIAIIYVKEVAPAEVIDSIRGKLEENKERDVTTVRNLVRSLGHPRLAITPTYISSELPGEMIQNLLNGRVVILMDQFSFAFAFPAIITDLWSTTLDVNYPYLFQVFLRTVRAIAALLAVTLPGLYVVLNSVNPELLRIQLAITVAKSREGVPYPSLIEMLLVMLLLEMIIEATIRLPKNIGPTITMIGGILLGQAIVQAKLVSNLLIIILVASAIANFALVGYMNTTGIRMYKYIVMLISSFFGIWGLEVAMIWIVLYLSSLKTSGFPYMSFSVKGNMRDE